MDTLPFFFPPWILLIASLLLFPFIFMYNYTTRTRSKVPPGPPSLPVIGNLHQVLGKDIHRTLWNLAHKYGPAMLLHFGTQPVIIISSTELATQVLKTHDHKICTRPYSKGTKRLSFNYMDVAFSPYGDHWRNMRKVLVSEFLGPKRTRLLKNVMEVELEGIIGNLSSSSAITVNLDDMFLCLVNDVVCKVAFGKSYREEKFKGKRVKEIVNETVVMLSGSFSDNFPTFGRVLDELTGWNRKLERCFSDIDGFLQMVIDEHHSTKASREENDLVDDLINFGLTNDEVKGILLNVLNGAIDTTSTILAWAMSETVKNPRVMQKLQTEIRSCVGRKPRVPESDISNMTYLKMVVKETLRLHPSPPFLLQRECTSHCQIGGYDIFPGTKVMVNTWGIGRDPRIWKDGPTQFHPERFENMEVDFGGKHFEMHGAVWRGKKRVPGV